MHELSVCQGLIRQVERIAAENDAHAVSRVVLKVGPLSGVEPDLLKQDTPPSELRERLHLDRDDLVVF